MKMDRLQSVIISFLVLFGTLHLSGAEVNGYKIVLASFETLDEAKVKLDTLGTRIEDSEQSLQQQYGFEITARPSGKAFILAIEPIKTETDAEIVLKQFKKFYPDAYINGYFGPTEGAVFLKKTEASFEEYNVSALDATQPTEDSSESNFSKLSDKADVTQNNASAVDLTKEPSSRTLWIVIVSLAVSVLVFMIGFRRQKRVLASDGEYTKKNEETVKNEEDEDRVEMIESEAFCEIEEVETPKNIQPKVFEPESDVFYKLKKNIFFMTLMAELKAAAETKDDTLCRDLMEEILRYQKNFRKSEVINTMKNFIEIKEYDKLSELINNEID